MNRERTLAKQKKKSSPLVIQFLSILKPLPHNVSIPLSSIPTDP